MQEYVSAKDSVKNPKKRCGSIAALRTYASGVVGTSLTSKDGWSPHRSDRAYLGFPQAITRFAIRTRGMLCGERNHHE
jgi:hypothetical protein